LISAIASGSDSTSGGRRRRVDVGVDLVDELAVGDRSATVISGSGHVLHP